MARVAGAGKISKFVGRAKGCLVFSLLLSLLLAALPAWAAEVRLSAAASMSDAIKELVTTFRQAHPGIIVQPNFASSGSLAKQIAQGAPVDLYISANQKWMDYLVEKKKIAPQTVHVIAYNGLVFVGRGEAKARGLNDLISLERIAIGSPKSVPAGHYAAQAMMAAGVYATMAREHRLVMAKDVRQALIYAERGEVEGAFVYRSDALLAREASILFTVEADLHDAIAYPMGLTPSGANNRGAQAFFAYLKSPAASQILRRYGFEAAERPAAEARP